MMKYFYMGMGVIFLVAGGILFIDYIVDRIIFNKKSTTFDAIYVGAASVICIIGAVLWKIAG